MPLLAEKKKDTYKCNLRKVIMLDSVEHVWWLRRNLHLAEAMLAFHSTRVQVETSTPPPIPYKSDKKLLLCVKSH